MDSIGKIIGTHGVKGLVVLEHNLMGDINYDHWDAIMIELLPGSKIPFFIESIKKQSSTLFLIKLEEIHSPEGSKEIIQKNVFLSPNVEAENLVTKTQTDHYIGFTLYNKDVEIGRIDNILNPKTNPLFILFENQENELLIPANEELITSVDKTNKKIIANLPEGLY